MTLQTLRESHCQDAIATAQADPHRERLARIRYTLCGIEVSYLVTGPIQVEYEGQSVEVSCCDGRIAVAKSVPVDQWVQSVEDRIALAKRIAAAARLRLVDDREKAIRELLEGV